MRSLVPSRTTRPGHPCPGAPEACPSVQPVPSWWDALAGRPGHPAPDGQIFDVITNSTGHLSAYALPESSCPRVGHRRRRSGSVEPSGSLSGSRAPRWRPRATTERKRRDEPHAADPARSRRRTRDVRGVGLDGLVAGEPHGRAAGPRSGAGPQAAPGAGEQQPLKPAAETPPAAARPPPKPYEEAQYRAVPRIGSRVAIWMVAQLHLLFAAFVLAIPIFALIVEAIGYKTGDRRYDRLAHEFTKLLSVSFSLTATFGAALTFMLIILYPKFTNYMMSVFSPTFLPYVAALLLRGLLPLHLLLRLGEVPPAGAPRPRPRPERRRHGDHVHRQLLADVHDVAARASRQTGR